MSVRFRQLRFLSNSLLFNDTSRAFNACESRIVIELRLQVISFKFWVMWKIIVFAYFAARAKLKN